MNQATTGARTHRRVIRRCLPALAVWILSVALSVDAAHAQFFGQNKVQYKQFDWKVLRTEHFDIYHYRGTEAAVRDAALMAERGYLRLSRVLGHEITERVPLVLYASHTDFEQTNITPGLIGLGTGGVTEFLKRRVFLPFTGSYAELDHVLTHELVHAFQVDILFGDRSGLFSNPFTSSPPLWFMEGMAEYLSVGSVDPNTQMWLRDAALEGYLVPIGTLAYVQDIRIYRFGHSIFQFIADTYGIAKVGEILHKTRRLGGVDRALEAATGLTVEVLSKKWSESVRRTYLPQIADHEQPDAIATRLTDVRHDLSNFNVAVSVSPSGTQMIYISDRSMYNDVYLASALDGKVFKKLISGERTGTFETLRFFNTSIAWAPDESRVAIPAKVGGEDAIYLVEIPSGKIRAELRFGLDAIYSPTWSPDGARIAFVGIKQGRSWLYAAPTDGSELRALLGGPHAIRDPAWSPDGRQIAFATDEGEDTDASRLLFGPLRVALYDLETGTVSIPPGQAGKNISPQWSPDGRSLLVVSDRDGISNLYRLDLDTGQSVRLTNLLTGISGIVPESPCISLAASGKRLLFTAFSRGGWDVFSVREPERYLGGPSPVEGATPLAARSLDTVGPRLLAAAADPSLEALAAGEPRPLESPPSDARPDSGAAAVDTTLALYVREVYAQPLADSTTFAELPYRAKLSRDYFSGGALFASNIGFAGSSVISFSDVLGNHNLLAVLNLFGDLSESDVFLAYRNLSRRTSYGLAVFQYRNDLLLFSSPTADSLEAQIYRGAAVFFARPFNRFRRLEYGIEAAVLNSRVLEYNYDLGTIDQLSDEENFFYVAPSLGLVADNALYGSTGPINGGRSRYSVEHALGDVRYTTALMDWRRYTNIRHRYALAQRLIAVGSFGRDPERFRLGGAFTFRGRDWSDLDGTRALLGNLEFRFPLIEQLRLGWPLGLNLGGINGVMFLDAASTWNEGDRLQFFTSTGGLRTRDLHLAYGAGARINLGYFILRYDFGREHRLKGGIGDTRHFVTFGADF